MPIIFSMFKLIFSVILIYLVLLLPNKLLWDRDNYLYYAEYSDKIVDSYHGIKDLIFNDYLFLKINQLLFNFFSAENIVNFFVAFSLGGLCFLIARSSVNFLTFLFGLVLIILITPILHLEVVAIRQALATTLVLFGLFYLKDSKKIVLIMLLSSLIHSAFFLFLLLFIVDNYFLGKFELKKRMIANAIIILCIALSYLIVASFLGMRQAELYASYDGAVGGGTFVLSLFIFAYLYFYGKIKLNFLYYFTIQGFLVFIVFYFVSNASVSARLLESVMPAFLILLVNKFRLNEVAIISLILMAYGYVWYTGGQYILFEASEIQVREYLFNWL